jgi:EmrB/QacA subfamily drug resistance transporter
VYDIAFERCHALPKSYNHVRHQWEIIVHSSTTDRTPQDGAAAPSGGLRRWWPLALLGAAQFMLIIDVTVVNVALPSIGRDLGLERSALTWVAIAYTLFFGSLLLLGGRLADSFGRRRIFLAGLVLFTVASAASGLASDGNALIISRALQGIGAALMSPAALSLITTTFQGPDRTRALGVWAALGGSGAAFGVVLGGLLAGGPGWQWIFFLNVPIGIAVALGVRRSIRALAPDRGSAGIDLPGVLLIVPSVAFALYAFVGAGDAGWTSPATLVPLALSAALLAAFVRREQTAAEPLVRLGLLADRALSGGLVLIVSASALLAGSFFLVSLYLQRIVGQSPFEAGLLFLPVALALIVGAQVGSRIVAHAGGRFAMVAGLAFGASGMLLLSGVPVRGDVVVAVLPGFVLAGIGIGAALVAAMTTAFANIADGDAGLASGLVNTSHEVGFAVGVSILSTIAAASLAGGGVDGFAAAFRAAAGFGIAAIVAAVLLLPADRPRVAGRAFAH